MFSIVIPLYNKEQYISKTIQSVISQTYNNFEIIIVDDGSTDNSLKEVEKFDDARLCIINQKNAGVSAARNRGIEESKYELIAFLDADDEWLPNHLQELMALKKDFHECQVFATDYKIVDPSGTERFPVNTVVLDIQGQRGVITNYFAAAIKTAPPLWSSAVAVTKEALSEIDAFPVGVRLGEDLLVWAKLADKYGIAYSKTITAVYNFKAYTELLDDEPMPDHDDVVGKSLISIYTSTKKNKSSLRKYISLWHRMRANLFINNNERVQALSESMKALLYNPVSYKNYVVLLLCILPHVVRYWISYTRLKWQQKSLS